MTQEQFDAAMPNEFWREVVDRVAQEVPDTLLLAEAFWMMEGYFVRTLGMHRVYNSAFMHMLRDEKNAEYHAVIRETVDFDPEILKRYVNFMNNPDEAHGHRAVRRRRQVLRRGNDAGDDARAADVRARPDRGFPREVRHGVPPGDAGRGARTRGWSRATSARSSRCCGSAGGSPTRATSGCTPSRRVPATTRMSLPIRTVRADTRSLVVYHNRYGDTRGFVSGVGERLGVADDGNRWVILRDHRSGLEFLRNAHDLHGRGLELSLDAYQAHVFLAFEEVVDTPEREWSRLAWRIGLEGVSDLHARADGPAPGATGGCRGSLYRAGRHSPARGCGIDAGRIGCRGTSARAGGRPGRPPRTSSRACSG